MTVASKHPFKVPQHSLNGISMIRRMPMFFKLQTLEVNTQKIIDTLIAEHPGRATIDATRKKHPHLVGNQKLYAQAKDDLYVLLASYAGEFPPGSQSQAYQAAVSMIQDASRLCKRVGIL